MSIFRRLKTFFSLSSTDLESWAVRCSKITTPDEIVVAAVLQSLAKDFDAWKPRPPSELIGEWQQGPNIKYSLSPVLVSNPKTGIQIILTREVTKKKDWQYHSICWGYVEYTQVKVDGISLDRRASRLIIDGLNRLIRTHNAAAQAADKAKKDMEDNEKKWNLAERLLGMKRNEYGALVPVTSSHDDISQYNIKGGANA